jgi:hypothetical protein
LLLKNGCAGRCLKVAWGLLKSARTHAAGQVERRADEQETRVLPQISGVSFSCHTDFFATKPGVTVDNNVVNACSDGYEL